jgi:hypothetical protein
LGATKSSTSRCLYCQKKIPDGGRRHRKFCKPGCRTLAYRARQRGAGQVDDSSPTPSTKSPAASATQDVEVQGLIQASRAEPVVPQDGGAPSEVVDIVADLNRQHDESSAVLRRLLDLVRSAQQRETHLQRDLQEAQVALRTRVTDVERLEAALAVLREQATKREQAEKDEEDVRRRLLQVERYVTALTSEQQRRRETAQAQLDEQASANELLRSDLSASLSRVRKLEETVKQLLDKKAELTQQLAVSQERLADTANRLVSQEEEVRRLQQHAEKSTAEQRVISDGIAHRAELEAEIQRLRQANEAQQADSQRQLAEATKRLDELVSNGEVVKREHAEQIQRLTTEMAAATQQHSSLLSMVREMALLPVIDGSPFTTDAAPLKTALKNPLVYFLEPIFAGVAPSDALNEHLMLFAVLFAQARVAAMITLGPDESAMATSEALMRYVLDCLRRYEDIYPEGTRTWAEGHEAALLKLERAISCMVQRQLARALSGTEESAPRALE